MALHLSLQHRYCPMISIEINMTLDQRQNLLVFKEKKNYYGTIKLV